MKKVRNRFLIFKIDCDLRELAGRINSNQYVENNGVGLISDSVENDSISATFVERKKVYDVISYPYNEPEIQERYKYIYFGFRVQVISDRYYLFQLIDPPASVKSFVEFLIRLCPRLSVEKFKFDLPMFHECIMQNSMINRVRVISLKASSLTFSENSAAKIEIFSENDSYSDLKRVYGESGYRLDRLIFAISTDDGDYEVLASASGVISYSESFNKSIVIESFVSSIRY